MDPSVQQEPNIIKIGRQNLNILSILLPFFTLLVGLELGLFTSRIIFPAPPQQSAPTPQITKSDLPISLALLKNPIVGDWRGNVTGKVIAKDEHTLTLEDDKGNKITVTDLMPSGSFTFKTMFLKYSKKTNSRPIELTLKDISLGTMLRGEFFVFKNFPDVPVGSQFIIIEE